MADVAAHHLARLATASKRRRLLAPAVKAAHDDTIVDEAPAARWEWPEAAAKPVAGKLAPAKRRRKPQPPAPQPPCRIAVLARVLRPDGDGGHLLGALVDAAPLGTVFALRGVSRGFRAAADARVRRLVAERTAELAAVAPEALEAVARRIPRTVVARGAEWFGACAEVAARTRVRAALANPECGWLVARGLRALLRSGHAPSAPHPALDTMARWLDHYQSVVQMLTWLDERQRTCGEHVPGKRQRRIDEWRRRSVEDARRFVCTNPSEWARSVF